MRSDAALAERFALGDEAAFDVIYERHRPVVLAVCMGVLGTPPDAEDATQETFSALAVALRTRPPAELRPWLIRVARNASIDTTRRRRHRLLTLDGEIPEIAARPAGGGQAELAVVLDGIRELPEGQRMALLMRELGGHSYAEIAEFLATDEEAVKGLIARARVGLRTYREATELSCATARNTIAAEPDGRRYDKTIRRHLRGCASCRGYRDALRDDAKALRAALPIQAGTVATGTLSSGMLSAAKGSLLGYGLTQAATTCAASACAVGAIGGMVFVAPVHKLGLAPILPAKSAPAHKHAAVKASSEHAAVPVTHAAITVSHSTVSAPADSGQRRRRQARDHASRPGPPPREGHEGFAAGVAATPQARADRHEPSGDTRGAEHDLGHDTDHRGADGDACDPADPGPDDPGPAGAERAVERHADRPDGVEPGRADRQSRPWRLALRWLNRQRWPAALRVDRWLHLGWLDHGHDDVNHDDADHDRHDDNADDDRHHAHEHDADDPTPRHEPDVDRPDDDLTDDDLADDQSGRVGRGTSRRLRPDGLAPRRQRTSGDRDDSERHQHAAGHDHDHHHHDDRHEHDRRHSHDQRLERQLKRLGSRLGIGLARQPRLGSLNLSRGRAQQPSSTTARPCPTPMQIAASP